MKRIISAIAISLSVMLLSSCIWPFKGKKEVEADLKQVYKESLGEGSRDAAKLVEKDLKEQKPFGYVEPYFPIRLQADVRRVWIPAHRGKNGDMVDGHWVYIVVEEERWYLDQ